MTEYDALPIFFGTDENAYGASRMYYEATGKPGIIYGSAQLSPTENSKLCDVTIIPKLNTKEHFLDGIENIRQRFANHSGPIILLGMGDAYPPLIAHYYDQLVDDFMIPYVSESKINELIHKNSFYQIAQQNGLYVPKTSTLNDSDVNSATSKYGYPVVLKANDSVEWYKIDFRGRAKVYIIKNQKQLRRVLKKAYANGYTGDFSLQEYLGGTNVEYTMTAYVDHNKNVRAMALGQSIMEDITPFGIGNHNAIMSANNRALFDQVKTFLENIDYHGFANIDFTFDPKQDVFKAFEMNVRMGRSSYWANLNGVNWIKILLEDYSNTSSYESNNILYNHFGDSDGKVWLQVAPKLFKKFAVQTPEKATAIKMIEQGKYGHGYFDPSDNSPERQQALRTIEKEYRMNYLRYGWQFWR